MEQRKTAIIGCGNMGGVLIRSLCHREVLPPKNIIACDYNPDRVDALVKACGVEGVCDVAEAAEQAEVIVLVVKPQGIEPVLESIAEVASRKGPLSMISVVTGVRIERFLLSLGAETHVVRVMPNLPSLVGEGITGIFAKTDAPKELCQFADTLFSSMGKTLQLNKEDHLDVMTALGGTGPAFIFAMIEALVDAAMMLGFRHEEAMGTAIQMTLGSAAMLRETGERPGHLIARVASPGGTTEAALDVLEREGFRPTIIAAVERATERAKELGEETVPKADALLTGLNWKTP